MSEDIDESATSGSMDIDSSTGPSDDTNLMLAAMNMEMAYLEDDPEVVDEQDEDDDDGNLVDASYEEPQEEAHAKQQEDEQEPQSLVEQEHVNIPQSVEAFIGAEMYTNRMFPETCPSYMKAGIKLFKVME